MNKILLFSIAILFSSTYSNAQHHNILLESGVSINYSTVQGFLIGIEDHGTEGIGTHAALGYGISINNRINLGLRKFVIKSSLGYSYFGDQTINGDDTNKAIDNLFMLDVMMEYHLKEYYSVRYFDDELWTPYVGLGFNSVYRSSGDLPEKISNKDVSEFITENNKTNIHATLKASLGLKYRFRRRLSFFIETSVEMGNKDNMLNNYDYSSEYEKKDYMVNISAGVSYIFLKQDKKNKRKLPWADLLYDN